MLYTIFYDEPLLNTILKCDSSLIWSRWCVEPMRN